MKRVFLAIFLISIFLVIFSCSKNHSKFLKLSGVVEGKEVEVSSRIPGHIKSLYFNEGDRVKKGDLMVLMDCSDYEIQKKQFEAMVESASSYLRLLEKGARIEDIRSAEEALKQSEINLRIAERDWNRAKKLFDEKSITEKQWEEAKAKYDFALAQFRQSEENLKKLKQGAREEEIESARSKLKEAISGLELIKKKIKDCEVRSPIDGMVSLKLREEGEFVSSGAPIMKILNTERVYIYVYFPEKDLGLIKIGDPVEIKIDSFPERRFEGKIVFISPEAEFTPKQIQTEDERVKLVFKTKIEIENREAVFKPGMFADVYIKLR